MSIFKNISNGFVYIQGPSRKGDGLLDIGAQTIIGLGETFEGSNYYKQFTYKGMIASGVSKEIAEEAVLVTLIDDGLPFSRSNNFPNNPCVYHNTIIGESTRNIDFKKDIRGPAETMTIKTTGNISVFLNGNLDARVDINANSSYVFSRGELLINSIVIANRPGNSLSTVQTIVANSVMTITRFTEGVYIPADPIDNTIIINTIPSNGTWTLTDGDDYTITGTGNITLEDVPLGTYTITWDSLERYNTPEPITVALSIEGSTITCTGEYTTPTEMTGSGTEQNPYVIWTVTDLQNVNDDLGAWYELGQDIDASDTINWNDGAGFIPIGADSIFTGNFDGKGNVINNLYMNYKSDNFDPESLVPESMFIGLFSEISDNTIIENIGLENCFITADVFIGGIAGQCNGIIRNSYINGTIEGYEKIGGIAGTIYSNDTSDNGIFNCYSQGNISGNSSIGGIVGHLMSDVPIDFCYSACNISGVSETGGLVGFIGSTPIVTNSYWDVEQTGQLTSAGSDPLFGLTTINMKKYTSFIDWDFIDTWAMYGNYPLLQWQKIPEITLGSVEIGTIPNNGTWTLIGELLGHSKTGAGNSIINNLPLDIYTITWDSLEGYVKPNSITTELSSDSLTIIFTGTYSEIAGSGTEQDPYIIFTIDELQSIDSNLSAWYELGQDIDASDTINWNDGAGFIPIGIDSAFVGNFNGKSYLINDLFINNDNTNIGLFSKTNSLLNIENIKLNNITVIGDNNVGGLIGYNQSGTISNCYVNGSITGGNLYTGGLIGRHEQGIVSNCYVDGFITGTGMNEFIGGLIGLSQGNISSCYTIGSVSGDNYIGGLIGYNSIGTVSDCYSAGIITGNSNTGGLVGLNEEGTISSSYWDITITGQATSSGSDPSFGLATDNMMKQTSFVGWDFTSTWSIYEDWSYPWLQWQEPPVIPTGSIEINTTPTSGTWTLTGTLGYSNIGTGNTTIDNLYFDTYTVTWDSLEGYNTPSPITIELDTDGSTITFTGEYTEIVQGFGNIIINIIPTSGTWTLTGVLGYSNTGTGYDKINNLPLDTYTVTWDSLEGYNTPNPITIALDIDGSTITFAGEYAEIVPEFGTIVISTTPTSGAWTLTSILGYTDSGTGNITIENVPLDTYTVTWYSLEGYQIPNPVTIELDTDGSTITFTGEYAAITPTEMTGSGTEQDPYVIWTVTDLQNVNNDLDAWYELGQDIDASATSTWNDGAGFDPIGRDPYFTGNFDGNGKVITNLYINRPGIFYVGLFAINNGVIADVDILDCTINAHSYVGSIAGITYPSGIIRRCFSKGSVTGSNDHIGGISGGNQGLIEKVYSQSTVIGGAGSYHIGGVVGYNQGGSLNTSYSAGPVSGENLVGGIIGNAGNGTVISSYWDINITGQATSSGSAASFGLTTANMKKQASFSGWDFTSTWSIYEDITYPWLQYQNITTGTVVINTTPNTGTWTITGPIGYSSTGTGNNTISNLPTGTYTVTWDSLAGYVTPDSVTIQLETENSTITFTGEYAEIVPEFGTIVISTTPTSGAWTLTSILGYTDSGTGNITIENVPLDTYTVTWYSLEGYQIPNPVTIELDTEGSTITFTGEYTVPTEMTGSGTEQDPYVIWTVTDLQNVNNDLDAWYELGQDIDASATSTWNDGAGFLPIGSNPGNLSTSFIGKFDGKGFKISNLYINRPSTDYIGLFGSVRGGMSLFRTGLINPDITGGNYTGGFVGSGYQYDENVFTITECYVSGGTIGGTGGFHGGIVGDGFATITNCYTTCFISSNNSYYGGIAGATRGNIINCYASGGGVSGVSGLTGHVDSAPASVTGSYWDAEISGQTTSVGSDPSFGLTTANMKKQASFVGWDFASTWSIYEDWSYPWLQWQEPPVIPTGMTGSGTEIDPYVIWTVTDLQNVNNNLTAWYELGQDIDASDTVNWNTGSGFAPIGHASPYFTGNFNGKGFDINNLYINRTLEDYIGLFGVVSNSAIIENVGLTNVNISGQRRVGGFIGEVHTHTGEIRNCYITGGAVRSIYDWCGGFVGRMENGATVKGCFSDVLVEVILTGGYHYGGFVGNAETDNITIENCYALGNVHGYHRSGGFIGDSRILSGGGIFNCYSSGAVTQVAGATEIGGFCGSVHGAAIFGNCYWDTTTSGQSTTIGANQTGLTTANMKKQASFSGWDFASTWSIYEDITYPWLQY